MRLHSGGRFRRWLGARFGGDFVLGDRVYRRLMHCCGALAVLYLVVPTGVLGVVPTYVVLLAALALVVALEGLRHLRGWELPTIRPYERERVGSYVFYAIALTAALLLFPRAVAAAVILGTALVDPLLGELRLRWSRPIAPALAGVTVYFALAAVAFVVFGGATGAGVIFLALLGAVLAIAAEWPTWGSVDDDLAITLVPGAVLTLVLVALPWLR